MICYFREGLKPSIKVEMEQQDRESMDFEEMVQRAVNAETKAGLRSSSMVRDSDIRCPRGHRPSNSTATKVQTQETKDSHPEEPKVKEVRPTPSRAEASKTSNQAHKKKKIERLGLKTWKTNVWAQKIDGSALKTFGMVIADFQEENKGGRPRFFQETFLVADTKFEVILGRPFLKLSNAVVSFGERTLIWKSYTSHEALPTTEWV